MMMFEMIQPVSVFPLAAMFLPGCLDLLFQLVWHFWMLLYLSKGPYRDKYREMYFGDIVL